MTTDFVRAVLDAIGSASLDDVRDDVAEGRVAIDRRARHGIVAVDGPLLLTALRNDVLAQAPSSPSRAQTSAKGGRRKAAASAQLLLPLTSTPSARKANGKNGIAKVTIEAGPPSIEDITNPDVLLAMLQGGEPTVGRAPEAPAKTRARAAAREKTLNGILGEAPARKAAGHATQAGHGAHASNGASNGANGASNGANGASHGANGAASDANAGTLAASDAAPVSAKNGAHDASPSSGSPPASESVASARPVSSGPRLRPGEEILRASAGGGAVIRRRRV